MDGVFQHDTPALSDPVLWMGRGNVRADLVGTLCSCKHQQYNFKIPI